MKRTLITPRNVTALIVSLWFGLAATSGHAAEAASKTNADAQITPVKSLPVVGVKDFLKEPESYSGKEIVLQGFVTEVCKRKGCWALLHDNDSDAKGQIRVKQNEAGDTFKAFLPELQGKTILVTGEVRETKIDNDYLDNWEAKIKAAQEKSAKADDKKAETDASFAATLKQIADYRDRVAKAKHGYLSSYTLAVVKWEPQAEKP